MRISDWSSDVCSSDLWVKLRGIHRSPQHGDIGKSLRAEKLRQLAGRHQRGIGAIVEAPQPRQHHAAQKSDTVAGGIVIEAGVKTGAARNSQLPRHGERRCAQWALGTDVQGIGTPPPPAYA